MKNIEHIFFDLDHTLWDFEKNSFESIQRIYELEEIEHCSLNEFFYKFSEINSGLWDQLDVNLINHQFLRENRFKLTFQILNKKITQEKSILLNELFLKELSLKSHLIEGVLDSLNYLKTKYTLHILSNGFYEIQIKKLKNSGILDYFTEIITQDKAQYKKPDPRIFDFALKKANATKENSLMIGDNLIADIEGAKSFGINYLWFSKEKNIEYQITHFSELKTKWKL